MRPSEPFVTEFLTNGKWKNITSDQVNREIYPFGTYSYLIQLCIVFLITDILRYKPIIIASSCVGLILWSLLLWTTGMTGMYLVQICYGFFMASEVAYYTYIYAKISKENYQKATGYTRASLLSGKALGCVLAQIFISQNLLNERDLNYISLGAQGVSFIVAIFLPSVSVSLYMWKIDKNDNDLENENFQNSQKEAKPKLSFKRASKLLWIHFKESYSNRTVLIWSLWWAANTTGFYLIINYIQLLWQQVDQEKENYFNGYVEFLITTFGSITATIAGYSFKNSFAKYDMYLLTLCSLLQGGFTIIAAKTQSIWVCYAMYILTGSVYHFIITLVTAFVAKFLSDDSFALVFGINTLIALVAQTIFTVVFVTETASFSLDPRQQFMVFGFYFIVLFAIFLIFSVVKFFRK
ncbi:hypothetical protein PVAND_016618 [Polypedilum vanderplanki]|uniref:Uncharacterized protein n=1 Tax=Polypedilum vanderplanki TaxID=319348 RepID=A0A9J6BFL6_POLVA|nr:hypothetical protein PVAND_016618 [Polypedilum vanderplanki]